MDGTWGIVGYNTRQKKARPKSACKCGSSQKLKLTEPEYGKFIIHCPVHWTGKKSMDLNINGKEYFTAKCSNCNTREHPGILKGKLLCRTCANGENKDLFCTLCDVRENICFVRMTDQISEEVDERTERKVVEAVACGNLDFQQCSTEQNTPTVVFDEMQNKVQIPPTMDFMRQERARNVKEQEFKKMLTNTKMSVRIVKTNYFIVVCLDCAKKNNALKMK